MTPPDIQNILQPHIPLLQWLARGSLKQNLPRSLRLWAILRYLYSHETPPLSDTFTYTGWRDTFFTPTHPDDDTIPNLHDPHCACAKTAAQWLFPPNSNLTQNEWQKQLQKHEPIPESKLNEFLQTRLFAVTRRSLLKDLHILVEIGWLKRHKQQYTLVKNLPIIPSLTPFSETNQLITNYELPFLHPDLEPIAKNHSSYIAGTQRFFLNLDYIISDTHLDLVDDLQYQLKEIWQQKPIPPIQFIYQSAKYGATSCITYPVCIYYSQRAVYLCALGRNPLGQENWYNYRLDRIKKIQTLTWQNPKIPPQLQQKYRNHTLPTPDYIQEQMAKSWGFDFYEPSQLMLLRFDHHFNECYIQGTFRHETFKAITYQQAQTLIQQNAPLDHQPQLLKLLQARSPQDAYYRVNYRENDTYVGLRLRSWRPKGEVIMPLELRQKLGKEALAEAQLYLLSTALLSN